MTRTGVFVTGTPLDARAQELRAALPPERQLTICAFVDLGDALLSLERLGIGHKIESPLVGRYYNPGTGRQSVSAVMGAIRFDYEGDSVRVEGCHDENEGASILIEHSHSVLPLLKLIEDVSDNPPGGSVYQMDGDWKDPEPVKRSLAGYGWGSVYTPAAIGDAIATEAREFFANADTYREMDLPHRRGFLLTGPPGNGKTSFARALVADNTVGFVLVTSVAAHRENPARQLRKAFEMAARIAPCVLCLEDVDGLIEGVTRNELLNQLDGLGRGGDGVLTVATTNHPEKLDAALTERPSRFDAKWIIKNPGRADRRGYLAWRLARSDRAALEATLDRLARETAGLTYAMLQDLALRAITRHRLSGEGLDPALLAAAVEVKAQIAASKRLAGDSGVGFLQED